MTTDLSMGKKSAFGIASTLAWIALLVSFLATAAMLTINSMDHVGDTASSIVNRLSTNPVAIDSLLNDFRRNADSVTVAEIDKNKSKIESAIASLTGDKIFQKNLASTLNTISQAILNGASSVTVDFGPLATTVAEKVNAISGSPVVSKEDLAKLKPQVIDLSKQAIDFSNVKNRLAEVILVWMIWLLFLGVIYLLRKWKVLRTAGWQLISVGVIFIVIRFVTPIAVDKVFNNSDRPVYQKDLAQEILKTLFGPLLTLSIITAFAGLILVSGDRLLRNRLQSSPIQISPSMVA